MVLGSVDRTGLLVGDSHLLTAVHGDGPAGEAVLGDGPGLRGQNRQPGGGDSHLLPAVHDDGAA